MQQEDSDEEEKVQHTARSSSAHAQRLPIFPGMDPAVLKVSVGRTRKQSQAGSVAAGALQECS